MTINVSTQRLLQIVQFALLLVIVGLLLWSQPWEGNASKEESRFITASGEAVIEATPNEFTFYPYFEATGNDRDALRDELTTTANQTVDALRQIGVEESDITLDASSYDRWFYQEEEGSLTVSLTIKTTDSAVAEDVQNYLVNTEAKGQLTSQSSFSEELQKQLDAQAVEQASQEAKTKAEAQAALFDAELGDVIEISQGFDSIFQPVEPFALDVSASSEASSLPFLPGENDYRQSVTVKYELK